MKSLDTQAKLALRSRYAGETDEKGYVADYLKNLIPGASPGHFVDDFERGDGGELKTKFRAVHSSSALVVNSFARFKDRPDLLSLGEQTGAARIEFEKQFPIFQGGTPPNMDVWVTWPNGFTAVESKLTEHLSPKAPSFSAAYDRLEGESDPVWWRVYEEEKRGGRSYLDRAQLIKHYFGLLKFRGTQKNDTCPIRLLYIFWEPQNANDQEVCLAHREEVMEFKRQLTGSSIPFQAMTYAQLWSLWLATPELSVHAQMLMARYGVSV